MPAEIDYPYDEAPGWYGWQSPEWLARTVIKGFNQNQQAQATSELVDSLADPVDYVASVGDFRLSSLVESSRDKTGWALAVAPLDRLDEINVSAMLFRVNRYGRNGRDDPPEIEMAVPIPVIRSKASPGSGPDSPLCKKEISELTAQFSKVELEVVIRTIGKITTSLYMAQEIKYIDDEDAPGGNGTISQMKALNAILRATTRMKTAAAVEPRVLSALQSYKLDTLDVFDSDDRVLASRPNQASQEQLGSQAAIEHVSEWHELISAANSLIESEIAASGQLDFRVPIQHEVDGSLYLANVRAENAALSGIQLICLDSYGTGHIKSFDLRVDTDDDDLDRNQVGPDWDREAVVACLEDGDQISKDMYDGYRETVVAETDDKPVNNVASLDDKRKKRPAA
jgi:hypothetical protein